VCDSLVSQGRCSKCLYHWKSVPAALAAPLSKLPLGLYRSVHEGLEGRTVLKKLRSFVSVPVVINARMTAWERATENARAVVAVCNWVRETILKNGVPEEKVFFSRHGLRLGSERDGRARSGPARFGYLGRVSPEKGIAVLLDALRSMPPELAFEFEFCSSSFDAAHRRPEEERLVKAVYELQARDPRVRVLRDISDARLREVLSNWDALVVPSLWLESGPQVVYEAFAVQTPVVGSRLGGIAELVGEGETGFLCEPGQAGELAALLGRFAGDPSPLRALRNNIPPVRTTADVAEDMLKVYEHVLRGAASAEELGATAGARA
jgi:glycosyltransferase involved in cell wall biosynthesis